MECEICGKQASQLFGRLCGRCDKVAGDFINEINGDQRGEI